MLVVFIDSIMKSQLRSPLDVKFTFVDSTEFTVCRKSFFFIFFFFFYFSGFCILHFSEQHGSVCILFEKEKKNQWRRLILFTRHSLWMHESVAFDRSTYNPMQYRTNSLTSSRCQFRDILIVNLNEIHTANGNKFVCVFFFFFSFRVWGLVLDTFACILHNAKVYILVFAFKLSAKWTTNTLAQPYAFDQGERVGAHRNAHASILTVAENEVYFPQTKPYGRGTDQWYNLPLRWISATVCCVNTIKFNIWTKRFPQKVQATPPSTISRWSSCTTMLTARAICVVPQIFFTNEIQSINSNWMQIQNANSKNIESDERRRPPSRCVFNYTIVVRFVWAIFGMGFFFIRISKYRQTASRSSRSAFVFAHHQHQMHQQRHHRENKKKTYY